MDLIALPYPKPDNRYKTGLQHVAFLLKEDLNRLVEQHPDLDFDTSDLNRTSHRDLKLPFEDLVVKFHNQSLEDLAQP